MTWTIYWDNGFDCGTWGHLSFDSEEEAQKYADSVTEDMIAEDIWPEEGYAEPQWLELEPPPSPEEIESTVEQSLDYFNHYIAGDR